MTRVDGLMSIYCCRYSTIPEPFQHLSELDIVLPRCWIPSVSSQSRFFVRTTCVVYDELLRSGTFVVTYLLFHSWNDIPCLIFTYKIYKISSWQYHIYYSSHIYGVQFPYQIYDCSYVRRIHSDDEWSLLHSSPPDCDSCQNNASTICAMAQVGMIYWAMVASNTVTRR